jgi:hypothetical protein
MTMETVLAGWTDQEQAIAKQAFDTAYGRAIAQLTETLRQRVIALEGADDLWQLHDFLSIQRHSIEGHFDFRLDGILFVFASLVKDNLLNLDELAGLEVEKIAKITAMSRF